MHLFDSPRMIFLKSITKPYARFKADRVDAHVKDLITFRLGINIVAQATKANIEFWRVIEEENG